MKKSLINILIYLFWIVYLYVWINVHHFLQKLDNPYFKTKIYL